MSGLLRRLRPSAPDPAPAAPEDPGTAAEPAGATATTDAAEPVATSEAPTVAQPPAEPETGEPQPADPGGGAVSLEKEPQSATLWAGSEAPATAETATADDEADAPRPPAGMAPEELVGDRPDTRRRSRLRRRLRHLRHVRELMLRDVGGLVYEIHRAPAGEGHGALVELKLDRLAALDAERRELEELLDDRRAVAVLREPGVGGSCPACGEYFASDGRFCSRCGTRVDGRAEPAPATAPEAEPATEPEARP